MSVTGTKKRRRSPPAVSTLETHIGYWLRFVSNHVSQSFANRLTSTGVTVAEWVVLREMFDNDVTSPSALAESTGLSRGAISKLVERLREKGLLTRAEASGDRRFQDIALTAVGRTVVPQLAALADQNDAAFFSALTTDERDALVAVLKKLVHAHKLGKKPID